MKKVIIVGAGVAGLTAGIYALQSGFDVTIYESHTIPGGASTSWRRKGYLFEGGMHWMTGSSPKKELNRMWREVGALDDNVPIHIRDPFAVFEYQGREIYLYRDIEKFRQHLLDVSPEDAKEIHKMCNDIKRFTNLEMPVTDIKGLKVHVKQKSSMSLGKMLTMVPALPRMAFYSRQTAKEYSERFQSPLIHMMLQNMAGPDSSAVAAIFTLATLAAGDGGYPEGGSLQMTKRMAERFKTLGGTIQYGRKVEKVSVNNGAADGVMLQGEREQIQADAVIVTQDTRVAIDTLFDEPICEPWAETMRASTKPMLNTFISVGVEVDLAHLPENITFIANEPIMCGGVPESVISINQYAGYKGYAPEGCTAITCAILGDSYDYWKNCKQNGTYEMEKQKLVEAFISVLEKRLPQVVGKIAVWDVATPLTYERYLGSYKGSWMSIMGKNDKMSSYPSKPETIKHVYFASQRITPPGGLPVAVETGRKSAQFLCKDANVVFQGEI